MNSVMSKPVFRKAFIQALCLPWYLLGVIIASLNSQRLGGWALLIGFVWTALVFNVALRLVERKGGIGAMAIVLLVVVPVAIIAATFRAA